MKTKRKRHDSQFKARVALEALKDIKTVKKIAKEFGAPSTGQVSDRKKLLSEQAGTLFESGKTRELEDFSMERADLHANIGELTVQLDHVAKKSKQLGVWSELPSLSKLSVRIQCALLASHA